MKILFIVNPIAGKNKRTDIISVIDDKMKGYSDNYKIIKTKAPKHAIEIAKSGLQDNYETIVAVGGDGTINEVAEGILETGYGKLGIVPMGTGNDLAKSLGLPTNPEEAIDIIKRGNYSNIDVGTIGKRKFLNVGSIGFDSEIVKNSQKLKKFFKGKMAYVSALLLTLFSYKNKNVAIELDDKSIEGEILLVAVGNGKYYGGGMKICPRAELNDDLLEVCIIKKISRLKLLFIFPSVFKGEHLKHNRYVSVYNSKKVRIKSNDNIYINIDGELLNFNGSEEFSVDTSKIAVLS